MRLSAQDHADQHQGDDGRALLRAVAPADGPPGRSLVDALVARHVSDLHARLPE